eukprot:12397648-Karenia_brevis.AAC.1
MRTAGLLCGMVGSPLEVISFNAAISMGAMGRQWQWVEPLFDAIHSGGLPLDVSSFSAAMLVCMRGIPMGVYGGRLQCVAPLLVQSFNDLRTVLLEVISFSAAMFVYMPGGQWQLAVSLLNEMWREGLPHGVTSFSAVFISAYMMSG